MELHNKISSSYLFKSPIDDEKGCEAIFKFGYDYGNRFEHIIGNVLEGGSWHQAAIHIEEKPERAVLRLRSKKNYCSEFLFVAEGIARELYDSICNDINQEVGKILRTRGWGFDIYELTRVGRADLPIRGL
ncbi:hypothetical protein J4462_03135 [Candidatus Pacearchaeota archaeon]|nr:hypothetical protein [Candidatus Pacearchaeota archaeon]